MNPQVSAIRRSCFFFPLKTAGFWGGSTGANLGYRWLQTPGCQAKSEATRGPFREVWGEIGEIVKPFPEMVPDGSSHRVLHAASPGVRSAPPKSWLRFLELQRFPCLRLQNDVD